MRASSMKNELDSCAFAVNEFLLSQLDGKPKALYQASSHYIRSGGKRLRPFMVIKSCELLGGAIKRALPAAGAVELVHNFTLVHDDIMDNDEMRHGVATVHHQYGLPLAILGGDILFSKAFEILSYNGRKVGIGDKEITEMVGRLANSCTVICEGQTIDIDFASNTKFPSESQYIDMIGKKTAALFEVSCAMGALSSPNPGIKDVDNLASFGRNIGVAFQLVDDLIGAIGDPKVTGKAAGNDIREGKKTLPILLALRKAKGDERDKLMKVFGSKAASVPEIKDAVKVVSDMGIDEDVRNAARQHMAKALASIEGYSNADARRSLQFAADFIVGRSL
ncbi:polyprenyl synthetase family protein [Nitrososphaera viennensis]|uniref:Geranylgeranyl pyrophosphate synthase n=2 Tax=Nitrososphaera viennensis TaxID=1034015 RepID=A0A060HP95_9ARCH|nr:polyprenyl synthetase family protein [Nitrososphaera viennensis]AIC15022.1 geranylgeranyl pyrophosphate synthase [Nitrososphaera viennensis EN76]